MCVVLVEQAEGYVIGSCIKHIPIAGKDITAFVQQLMRERETTIPPAQALQIAKRVKETYSYVCPDIVKEFKKYDTEPSKWFKQYEDKESVTQKPFVCDIGYERFLGPEIFFNPEICSSDFLIPLPAVTDAAIQSCPIDTRRGLYKVRLPPSRSSLPPHTWLTLVCSAFRTLCSRVVRPCSRTLVAVSSETLSARSTTASSAVRSSAVASSRPRRRRSRSSRTTCSATPCGSVVRCWLPPYVVAHAAAAAASNRRPMHHFLTRVRFRAQPEFYNVCHTKAQYEEHGPSICRHNPVFGAVAV